MNRFVSYLFALLIFSFFLGCDSLRNEVDPERLNKDAGKLVVHSFLSPQDTLLAVSVNRSATILDDGSTRSNSDLNVTNALVTLSEESRLVILRYDLNRFSYTADAKLFPIQAGHSYNLTVQTPDGEQVTSSCTIPEAVEITKVTFDSLSRNQFGRTQVRYFAQAHWQDPAEQSNFYQVTGKYRFIPDYGRPDDTTNREIIGDAFFDEVNAGVLNDNNRQGENMISKRAFFGNYFFEATSGFTNRYKQADVTLSLMNIDGYYYQYQDAVGRQLEVLGNPFAEPVPIPSNIQGGLGCFAGYNRSTLTLKLK